MFSLKQTSTILVLACALGGFLSPLLATPQKTAQLSKQINTLKQNLAKQTESYNALQNTLAKTETQIGDLNKNLVQTKQQLSSQQTVLRQTTQKQQTYAQQLETQQAALRQMLQLEYQLHRQSYFKLILNQQAPSTLHRYLIYSQAIDRARLDAIKAISQTKQKIEQNRVALQQQTQTLSSTLKQQQSQKQALLQNKKTRQQLLKQTQFQIRTQQQKLSQLIENKKQLEKVITDINPSTFTYTPGKSFAQMRGHLYWPVTGRLLQTFNQTLNRGQWHSTGILIQAPAGTKVHAIFDGKIVYANWLRGFGLLVIEQHDSNYLSLYGRNQSLYVQAGEMVKAGQVIATVGNSGGFDQNALYFEIRRQNNPLNPLLWLSKR